MIQGLIRCKGVTKRWNVALHRLHVIRAVLSLLRIITSFIPYCLCFALFLVLPLMLVQVSLSVLLISQALIRFIGVIKL